MFNFLKIQVGLCATALLLAFASCQKTEPVVKTAACDCERVATTLSASLDGKAKTDPATGKLSLRLPTENGVWRELCNPAFALEAIRLLPMPQDSIFKLTGKLSPVCKEDGAADGKTSKQFYKVEAAELRPPMDNTYQNPCKCDVPKPNRTTVTGKLQLTEWGDPYIHPYSTNETNYSSVRSIICNQTTALLLIKNMAISGDSLVKFEANGSEICGTPNDGPATVPVAYRFYEVISIKN